MKLFNCTNCEQLVYFENSSCECCGSPLGFESNSLGLVALEATGDKTFKIYNGNNGDYRYCANHEYKVCNWLVPTDSKSQYCEACTLNRTIPNLSKQEYRQRWNIIENGKHRLIYQLKRMHLPIQSKAEYPENGLSFDFMADDPNGEKKILTGHDSGVITLNISEADDVEREMTRKGMAEVYRTVLGHFRHEVGHYYWDILIDNSPFLEECRQLFGDDTRDYDEALKIHYRDGAPSNWNDHYISAYATTHPWEDWAETWAHYLHIIDTMETAYSFGLRVKPAVAQTTGLFSAEVNADPYEVEDFERVINQWIPVTFALNSLNRSMGLHDTYPFVIPPAVIEKLKFIHKVCISVKQH